MLPLTELLLRLKDFCEDMLDTMVEVEFAVRLAREGGAPAEFGFLQVRPMVVSDATVDIDPEELVDDGVLLSAETALGNGVLDDIRDVVYVKPGSFDIMRTNEVPDELERVNASLVEVRRPYLLIGFGRWGTTDPLGGIPANFGQISGAKVIVESSLPNLPFVLSQGSHFFHNVTSFRILYFCVRHDEERGIDWPWLERQPARFDGELVRHVELSSPLRVKVDGRTGRGVVLHD
jgi:hypothetical protein